MIYQLSQVSNRDTQILYFYRILRHSGTDLSAIYRYDKPDLYQLSTANAVEFDNTSWFEYHLDAPEVSNRIPYLEFICDDEVELEHIEDLVEVEVTGTELILRGTSDELTEKTTVAVYWVPSLAYIRKLQDQIEATISDLKNRAKKDEELIDRISISSDYVMNLDGVVPNLVNIGEDEIGLIYDDSHYMLSGSLSEQTLVNPPQSVVSGLLKSHIGTLVISDMLEENKVYQGFYGGCIRLSGTFKTLVLKDITSIIFMNKVTADKVIIENCPAVILRQSIEKAGRSGSILKLEVRNSYLTVHQPVSIKDIWCYRRSTVVMRTGTIHTIGFIEAGSSLVYDSPTSENKIENIKATRLQGLFYASNPPKDKLYLDEVFLAQKPISFQRGTIEDPVPTSEAEVNVYLKHSEAPGPSPGPSPGGKIYSPFVDWYWSGDSRTVGLINATGTDGQGFGGEGLSKLVEQQDNVVSGSQNHNLALWWGVNGLQSGYPPVYQEIADSLGDNGMVFVCTIGRVFDTNNGGTIGDEGGWGTTPISDFNDRVKDWNEQLKSDLSSSTNIHILDVWQFIEDCAADHDVMDLAESKGNGLHYSNDLSRMIYDWVCSQVTNQQGSDFPDAPTDTNAGKIWNWFKSAGITDVSDKPELIAGIIGNCQQESYGVIDLLGCNNGYYGPWCESNAGFRLAVTNAGYSFHQYTTTPGDDSAAIPTIFNWLTQQSDSWVNWLAGVIDQVADKTGEAGARAYAELFCVCIERCVGGSDAVLDSGVHQIMTDYYGGTVYYQDLDNRRDNAANIYNQFMGG